MSRYARLVEALSVQTVLTRERVELSADTEIKRVRVVDDPLSGHFVFEARIFFQSPALRDAGHVASVGWLVVRTDEDLPAFTDKGRESRASHATLRRGRPNRGETKATQRLACKVTVEQAAYVERCAAQLNTTVSEYVRRALIADGMPE